MLKQRPMPWREVLFVNAFMSLILGGAAYVGLQYFAEEADAWVRGHSPEQVKAMAEILVLLYLAYAVSMILIVVLSIAGSRWLGPKTGNSSNPEIPADLSEKQESV